MLIPLSISSSLAISLSLRFQMFVGQGFFNVAVGRCSWVPDLPAERPMASRYRIPYAGIGFHGT